MDPKAGKTLEKVASESLGKCASRLSRVSGGQWTISAFHVSLRTMRELIGDYSASGSASGAAVYFTVSGEYPFTSMVVFRPEDIGVLARGFLGGPILKLPDLSQAQELLFSELGNIILNSLLNALSGAVGRPFIPSAPKCVKGGIPFLLEALWSSVEPSARRGLVTVKLDLRCGDAVTGVEVLALIPPAMEAELAALEP